MRFAFTRPRRPTMRKLFSLQSCLLAAVAWSALCIPCWAQGNLRTVLFAKETNYEKAILASELFACCGCVECTLYPVLGTGESPYRFVRQGEDRSARQLEGWGQRFCRGGKKG